MYTGSLNLFMAAPASVAIVSLSVSIPVCLFTFGRMQLVMKLARHE